MHLVQRISPRQDEVRHSPWSACGGARAVLVVLAMLLEACGLTVQQQAAVGQFATATRELATTAQEEFRQSRQDVIEMNRLRLELGDPTADVSHLDGLLTLERSRERIVALRALEGYADLLGKLVGTVSEAELLEAGNTFVGSLKQVKGATLSDQEAEGIGRAVAAVGGLYVEHKRADAVRQVVESSHASVVAVTDTVKRDFDPNSDFWNAGYRQTALALKGHAVAIGPVVPGNDLASQQGVQRAKTLATENVARSEAVSAQVIVLTGALADAQENLRLMLTASDLNVQQIEYLSSRVREFQTIYGLLRSQAPR